MEDPEVVSENLNRHLSRDRVASAQAARSAERLLRERNRNDAARQAILDGRRRVVAVWTRS